MKRARVQTGITDEEDLSWAGQALRDDRDELEG